jgi:hypothetical protein
MRPMGLEPNHPCSEIPPPMDLVRPARNYQQKSKHSHEEFYINKISEQKTTIAKLQYRVEQLEASKNTGLKEITPNKEILRQKMDDAEIQKRQMNARIMTLCFQYEQLSH